MTTFFVNADGYGMCRNIGRTWRMRLIYFSIGEGGAEGGVDVVPLNPSIGTIGDWNRVSLRTHLKFPIILI